PSAPVPLPSNQCSLFAQAAKEPFPGESRARHVNPGVTRGLLDCRHPECPDSVAEGEPIAMKRLTACCLLFLLAACQREAPAPEAPAPAPAQPGTPAAGAPATAAPDAPVKLEDRIERGDHYVI